MIDHDKKIIFVHIPKTGGSSIEETLGWHKDHLFIDQFENFKEYKKITFVRNPWDRLVSSFCFSLRPSPAFATTKNIDKFEKYLQNSIRGIYRKNKDRKRETDPQTWWIKNFEFDFIGRYENYIEDFYSMCQLLSLNPPKLKHVNKTERNHYSLYYRNKTTVDLVGQNYKEEIEKFNYYFEKQVL